MFDECIPLWMIWNDSLVGETEVFIALKKMSFTLPPGAIIGVIGPNGAGKTTLFNMITGKEKPESAVR